LRRVFLVVRYTAQENPLFQVFESHGGDRWQHKLKLNVNVWSALWLKMEKYSNSFWAWDIQHHLPLSLVYLPSWQNLFSEMDVTLTHISFVIWSLNAKTPHFMRERE
jgi:hypothetical protein